MPGYQQIRINGAYPYLKFSGPANDGPRPGLHTANPGRVFSQRASVVLSHSGPQLGLYAAGPIGLSCDEGRTASQSVGPSDCSPCQAVIDDPQPGYSLHTAVPTGPS